MPFSEKLRQLTLTDREVGALREAARSEGMTMLRDNAIKIMLSGQTTYQEVLRVTADS
jgi:general secretion pathway protein E